MVTYAEGDELETDIIKMFMFGGRGFQQTVGIPIWVPIILLFKPTCSYEADFILEFLKYTEKNLVWAFNFIFRYKDDVLSVNDSKFGDYVVGIYPIERDLTDATHLNLLHSYTYT